MISSKDKDDLKYVAPKAAFGLGAATGLYANESDRLMGSKNRAIKAFNTVRRSRYARVALPAAGGIAAYKKTVKATGKRNSPNKDKMLGTLTGGTIGGGLVKALGRKNNAIKVGLGAAFGAVAGGMGTAKLVDKKVYEKKQEKVNQANQIKAQAKYHVNQNTGKY